MNQRMNGTWIILCSLFVFGIYHPALAAKEAPQTSKLAPSSPNEIWVLDPMHTQVEFSVRHMMISNVKGNFTEFKGTVEGDPAKPASAKVNVSINVNSINSGVPKR